MGAYFSREEKREWSILYRAKAILEELSTIVDQDILGSRLYETVKESLDGLKEMDRRRRVQVEERESKGKPYCPYCCLSGNFPARFETFYPLPNTNEELRHHNRRCLVCFSTFNFDAIKGTSSY